MTIQQCKYVLTIAKTGSFNEAAKQLFLAQSTLSLSIKALEQELNIKIFVRSGNGVFLTEEGSEFEKYARQIVENSELIINRYSKKTDISMLRIVTQHYDFIADIFGKMLLEMENDSYELSLCETRTYDVIKEIEIARSDIGIIAIKSCDFEVMKRYLMQRNISFTPFLSAKPHVFIRKNHPLAAKTTITTEDLLNFPCVLYDQGEKNTSFFTEELIYGFNPNKRIEISDRATLMNILLITDSYTVGTGIMPSALNNGDIASVPFESNDIYIIGYLLHKNKSLSDVAKKFIEKLPQKEETAF